MLANAKRGVQGGRLIVVVELDVPPYQWHAGAYGPQTKTFGGASEAYLAKSDEWIALLEKNAGLQPGTISVSEVDFASTVGYVNYSDDDLAKELAEIDKATEVKLDQEDSDESEQGQSGSDQNSSRPEDDTPNSTSDAEPEQGQGGDGAGEPSGDTEPETPAAVVEPETEEQLGAMIYLVDGVAFLDNQMIFTVRNDSIYTAKITVLTNGIAQNSAAAGPGEFVIINTPITVGTDYRIEYLVTDGVESSELFLLFDGAVWPEDMTLTDEVDTEDDAESSSIDLSDGVDEIDPANEAGDEEDVDW